MSEGANAKIINETDKLARQFHERYEELAPLYGYTTRNDTRVFDPESPNGQLMRAVCLQVVGPIIAERDKARAEAHRARSFRQVLKRENAKLKRERDEARGMQVRALRERESTEREVDAMLERAIKAERERDEARRALELIAEDCEAWLRSESDEPSAEFIKLVAKYAREQSSELSKELT